LEQLRLCLVTDRMQTGGRDLLAVVGQCLGAGLPAVQLREKDLGAVEVLALARELRRLTAAAGAWLIVNDRADVAVAARADGVQRTHTSLSVEDLRVVADRRVHVGASVHSVEEAEEWIVFGPIYDTPSKRRYGTPQGLAALTSTTRKLDIPVIAIGGITPERVAELCDAGAAGVAVISAILTADSPPAATQRFLAALDAAAR
jgi:thiamine-phosphate pyrophosphorylase